MPGYSASVRPSTTYTNGVKNKLLRDAGISATEAPSYELDHLVPLAFGRRPRNLKNLALQPWDEAKQKGRSEFYSEYKIQVCTVQRETLFPKP